MKREDDAAGHGAESKALGADLVIPVLAALFALYFFWDTWRLDWEARINGLLIGIPLMALVMFKIGSILLQVAGGTGNFGLGEIGGWDENQRRRLILFGIFVGLALTISWLGVTLGLFLSLLLSMLTLGVRNLALLTLVPTVTSGTVYLLFIVLLHKRMPHGPIENGLAALWTGGS